MQGVLAWAPFAFFKYIAQEEISVAPFLAWHLLGVLPGVYLKRRDWLIGMVRRIAGSARRAGS
jgi:hypothetical protein